MIPLDKGVELERIARERGEHRTGAVRVVDAERFPTAAAFDLVVAGAAHVVVVIGVQREQHANPAIRLDVEYEQVTVEVGSHVDARPVSAAKIRPLVHPNLDGRLRHWTTCRSERRFGGCERERCQQ